MTVVLYDVDHSPPADGTCNEYELSVDTLANIVYVYFNNNWVSYWDHDPGEWTASSGEWAVWSGEIAGHETDMPGTSSNKCEFARCQYSFDGGGYYYDAQFDCPPDTIGTSNRAEWDLHYFSGYDDFRIWDINPQ